MVSSSWRCHTQRTPAADTLSPRRFQFIGAPYLTPGGLFDRQPDYRVLNLGCDAILQDRPAPRDLLQRRLAALVVEVLEAL
jgi:hypothetical protein